MKLSILAPLAALALVAAPGCSKPEQPVNSARTARQGVKRVDNQLEVDND